MAARIDSAGWGLFLLWVGASLLLGVGWGIGLLGVGGLILLVQGIRRGVGLPCEGFWLLIGMAFVLVAVWELAAIDVALGPVVLVGAGAAIVLWALRR